MPFKIEDKLVIAVATSALFQLDEANTIYQEKGIAEYRKFQREHQLDVMQKGIAFPFIKRFLKLNVIFPEIEPVEVVLLSHNDPDTGLRVFNSIRHYGLGISRAAFTTGDDPHRYIPAYNVSLFLSANQQDVMKAVAAGYPAGQVLHSQVDDESDEMELRVGFDFDGVIADDSAEAQFKQGGLSAFLDSESQNAEIPLPQGPLASLFRKLAAIRELEDQRILQDPQYKRFLKTSIITARNAPADERLVTTLRAWNIQVDQTFLLGGMDKGRILEVLRPHIFFDDQRHPNLDSSTRFSPSVHIPFGIANSVSSS